MKSLVKRLTLLYSFTKMALLGATAPWFVEVDKSRLLKMALLGAAKSTKVNDQHVLLLNKDYFHFNLYAGKLGYIYSDLIGENILSKFE